jgi:hypothetical protein
MIPKGSGFMADSPNEVKQPTPPTSPTTTPIPAKLRVFSMDRVKMKCFLSGKYCCPSLLCEYIEEGKKPRKGYVDPEFALDSGLLNESDHLRVSQLVRSNSANWQTMSEASFQKYLTPGNKEHDIIMELSRWEASDAYRFPELYDEKARNWLLCVQRGSANGITKMLIEYIGHYGNSRDSLRTLREISYGCEIPDVVKLYVTGRTRAWKSEEQLKVQCILNSYSQLISMNYAEQIRNICKDSKVELVVREKDSKNQIVDFISALISPWSVTIEESTETENLLVLTINKDN